MNERSCSDCQRAVIARHSSHAFCTFRNRHIRTSDVPCNQFKDSNPLRALSELTERYREAQVGGHD